MIDLDATIAFYLAFAQWLGEIVFGIAVMAAILGTVPLFAWLIKRMR